MGKACGCKTVRDYQKEAITQNSLGRHLRQYAIEFCPLHRAAQGLLDAASKALPYVANYKKHACLKDIIEEANGEKPRG